MWFLALVAGAVTGAAASRVGLALTGRQADPTGVGAMGDVADGAATADGPADTGSPVVEPAGEPADEPTGDEEPTGVDADQSDPGPGQRPTTTWPADPRVERALGVLPLGVVVTDIEGQVIYRNQFAEQFENARHADALVEAAIGEVITAALAGQTLERPIDLYGPPARSLLLRALPTYEDDQLNGSVVVVEDITLNLQVDRVRRDFVANVSHELRTPIGAIGLLAETLRDADEPEVVDRLAGRLHNEALRLGDMIDDLLALSRLETGEVEEPDTVDVQQAVHLAVERATSAAEQREITIEILHASKRPVLVDGDQGQIVSAVFNLLDNAVKYSDRGETITAALARDDEHCRIIVSDRGVGIPEAALNRIFERFYRVDDARSRATGGTGLGLSIVRHVALNHRGTISVESTEGEGSSFTMELPLSALHRDGLATRPRSIAGHSPLKQE
jgi:two-component system sensor histidine kinase SenX3